MDPLSALIDAGERTTDIRVRNPWSVVLAPSSSITLVAVVAGEAWCHGVGESLHVRSGDLLVLQPHETRVLSSSPRRAVAIPGPDDTPVVTGADPEGPVHLVTRFYPVSAELVSDFFAALPSEQVLEAVRDSPLWPALRDEATHLSVARSSALGRLVDLLFIDGMRRWATEGQPEGWMRAVLDPIVGGALRLFHTEPEHAWSAAEVAARLGTSAASLTDRFELFVGEPPMTYLRHWRLARAATLLAERDLTVTTIATRCGFADPFVFSAEFSKEFGVSPTRYRALGPLSAGSA